MVNQQQNDIGMMTVLFERFKKQRLPRALALKEKVERGEPLINFDVMFLQEVADSMHEMKPFLDRHPECHKLATQLVNLCNEVAAKGLRNEKAP